MAYLKTLVELREALSRAFPRFEVEIIMGEVWIDNGFVVVRIHQGYRVDCETYGKSNMWFTDTAMLITGLHRYLEGR